MRLTEQEINVLNKITRNSKMDYWFDLRIDKNGLAYVYDLEMNKKLSFKRAIQDVLDGLVDGSEYLDTKTESIIFNEIKAKALGVKKQDVLDQLISIKENSMDFIYDYYDVEDVWLKDLTALDIAIDLVKKYYKEDK